MSEQNHSAEKAGLIIASTITGLTVFLYRSCERIPVTERKTAEDFPARYIGNEGIWITIPLTVGIIILYPIIGAFVVKIWHILRSWAHDGKVADHSKNDKIVLAAIWPIALIVSVIFYPFLGLINRLFKD